MSPSEDFTMKSTTSNHGTSVNDEAYKGSKDTAEYDRRIWRKMDTYVLPIVTLFFFFSWLDRVNVGNAQVAGLQRDLGLTSVQYSTALTVTFIPYVLTELPSNLILKIVGPNVFLPTLLLCWGVVTIMQGFVYNYAGFIVCRFFIGFFEGGVLPGSILYLSGFYPRDILQLRLALFFAFVALAGAFSGLLATAILKMHGIGDRPGWSWIFILEGILTVMFGGISFRMLPSSPDKATFLSQEEKDHVMERLRMSSTSAGDDDEPFNWHEVWETFRLPHVWLMSISQFSSGISSYAIGYFTPTLVYSLGFSPIRTQLMTVPPFVVAFAVALCVAYVSDRKHARGMTLIFGSFCTTVGFAIYIASTVKWVLFCSLFFTMIGLACVGPAHQTWMANNTSPYIRRATGIAFSSMLFNASGILSTWLFGPLSGPPRYTKAMVILLIFSIAGAIFAMLTLLYLWDQNKRKAKKRAISQKKDEPVGLGNKSAWFVYIL